MRCRGMMREPRSRMNWWRGRMKKSIAFLKLLCYDVKNNLKGSSMMNVMLNSLERREEERRLL